MMGRKMARRFHDVSGFAGELKHGVVAIGNFDGMHRGHQAVLAQAMETAASLRALAHRHPF
jgi:riboflavin kinase/FMN adenylyltransferase